MLVRVLDQVANLLLVGRRHRLLAADDGESVLVVGASEVCVLDHVMTAVDGDRAGGPLETQPRLRVMTLSRSVLPAFCTALAQRCQPFHTVTALSVM